MVCHGPGLRNRQVAANHANENSSRSHCILTVNIDKEFRTSDEDSSAFTKHGKLIFVDLAGSEKVREIKNTSMQETNKINRSLLTLGKCRYLHLLVSWIPYYSNIPKGKCVSALGDNHKKHGHIPYRDSKLTKLLAESLGGNGVTLMVGHPLIKLNVINDLNGKETKHYFRSHAYLLPSPT